MAFRVIRGIWVISILAVITCAAGRSVQDTPPGRHRSGWAIHPWRCSQKRRTRGLAQWSRCLGQPTRKKGAADP